MEKKYSLKVKATENSDLNIKIEVCTFEDKEKSYKVCEILNKFSKDKDIVDADYRFSSLMFDMRAREELIVRLMGPMYGTEPYDFVNYICELVKHFDIYVHDNIWEIEEN